MARAGTVAVVDCGMGNLHSVLAGARRVAPALNLQLTSDAAAIRAADKVILPGDGNFGACMNEINSRGLRDALIHAAAEKPFLGICVGMQVLFRASEESDQPGLGIFNATVQRLPATDTTTSNDKIKVPHMGWNNSARADSADSSSSDNPALSGIDDGDHFYFIHSYYAPLGDWTLMHCDYGVRFSAVVGSGALIATQFHPEKSGARGLRLLQNFLLS